MANRKESAMYTDDIIQTINNHNGTLPSKLYAFICDDSKQIRQVSYNGYENRFYWERDKVKDYPKIHPTQKPVNLLKQLIEIFTDEGDVVIDPVAGSGTTLRACMELNRNSFGFEIKKDFCKKAKEKMLIYEASPQMSIDDFLEE